MHPQDVYAQYNRARYLWLCSDGELDPRPVMNLYRAYLETLGHTADPERMAYMTARERIRLNAFKRAYGGPKTP